MLDRLVRRGSVVILVLVGIVFSEAQIVWGQEKCPNVTRLKQEECNRKLDKVLRISVLLPSESTDTDPHNLVYHNRLEWVQAGLEVAGGNGNASGLPMTSTSGYQSPLTKILPDWRIEVRTGDTQCSSTHGPLEAFRMHCDAGKQDFVGNTLYQITVSLRRFSPFSALENKAD